MGLAMRIGHSGSSVMTEACTSSGLHTCVSPKLACPSASSLSPLQVAAGSSEGFVTLYDISSHVLMAVQRFHVDAGGRRRSRSAPLSAIHPLV